MSYLITVIQQVFRGLVPIGLNKITQRNTFKNLVIKTQIWSQQWMFSNFPRLTQKYLPKTPREVFTGWILKGTGKHCLAPQPGHVPSPCPHAVHPHSARCREGPQTCKSEAVCRGLRTVPSLDWELWDRRTLSSGIASHDSKPVIS